MKKMQKSLVVFFMLLCLMPDFAFGQVELSRETTEKKKKEGKEKKSNLDGATSIYVIANWSNTTRLLKENDGLFGDSLGERTNELPLNTWSFGLGFSNRLHKNVVWQGGIAYMKNGEKYSYNDSDSSYAYETRYSYVAMPIKALFTYGDKIQLLAGFGIVPQMTVGYKKDVRWSTTEGGALSETIEVNSDKANSFVLSTVFNLGAQLKLSNRMSILILPEYKVQLSSSFSKNSGYKHFARSLGLNFGLVFQL